MRKKFIRSILAIGIVAATVLQQRRPNMWNVKTTLNLRVGQWA